MIEDLYEYITTLESNPIKKRRLLSLVGTGLDNGYYDAIYIKKLLVFYHYTDIDTKLNIIRAINNHAQRV